MSIIHLATQIKKWGQDLGFQQVGITDTHLESYEERFLEWLAQGFHGTMDYMANLRCGTNFYRWRPA